MFDPVGEFSGEGGSGGHGAPGLRSVLVLYRDRFDDFRQRPRTNWFFTWGFGERIDHRRSQTMLKINNSILKYVRTIEMVGVVMRITSFTLVSWLGPDSPFMFV